MTALNLARTTETGAQTKPRTISLRPPAARVFGDELFPDGGLAAGAITCRVCDRVELVGVGHPALLCSHCLTDVSITAAHVAGVYAAALAFFIQAGVALSEAVGASTEKDWWGRVEAARGAVDYDADLFATAWERAKVKGGERARLCLLWEALDREAVRLAPINAWYTSAEKELKAARTFLGEPVEV